MGLLIGLILIVVYIAVFSLLVIKLISGLKENCRELCKAWENDEYGKVFSLFFSGVFICLLSYISLIFPLAGVISIHDISLIAANVYSACVFAVISYIIWKFVESDEDLFEKLYRAIEKGETDKVKTVLEKFKDKRKWKYVNEKY